MILPAEDGKYTASSTYHEAANFAGPASIWCDLSWRHKGEEIMG
jgi:hypothetical protein